MTNEEIIDYILYERLYPIISLIDSYNFEDGDTNVIEQLRQIWGVWSDETKEMLFCQYYLQDNPDNSIDQCKTMLFALIGESIMYKRINRSSFEILLHQMRICMLKDKDNPFFKLKRIKQKKQDIEQDFV